MVILFILTAVITAILAYGYFWIVRKRHLYPQLYNNRGIVVLVVSLAMEAVALLLRN